MTKIAVKNMKINVQSKTKKKLVKSHITATIIIQIPLKTKIQQKTIKLNKKDLISTIKLKNDHTTQQQTQNGMLK
jgi:hypothetical protein